MLEMDDVS